MMHTGLVGNVAIHHHIVRFFLFPLLLFVSSTRTVLGLLNNSNYIFVILPKSCGY